LIVVEKLLELAGAEIDFRKRSDCGRGVFGHGVGL
jgi:hypothetical protein